MTREDPDRFEAALARRLAKLSAMPVDTGGLERRVRAQVGPAGRGRRFGLVRAVLGIAAGLILVALVSVAFMGGRPAQASADSSLMLQLHRDIVSGKVATMHVDSVAAVNEAFKAFGQSGVQISAPPEMKMMACCMQDVGDKKVACVLLDEEKVPVTLTVASLDAVKPLQTPVVMHHGEMFHVQSSGDLTMVTVDRGDHRICLIGGLSSEKLMALTDQLKF